MSRKVALYVTIAVAAFWGIWLVGYILFNLDDEKPGDGRGQVTTVER